MTHVKFMPAPLWFSRWVVRRWVLYYAIAGGGYLANVVGTGHLTLIRFLLLTGIYGVWLGIVHIGKQFTPLPHWWMLALISLACASQFIPLANTNLNWLPILPTTTACLLIALTPRVIGMIAAGSLWLSSSLAFSLNMHGWNLNTQLTLLVTFISFVGLTKTMRELTLAHLALADSNTELAAAHAQLQEYSSQAAEMAALRERNRMAREIHDTLGHSLTLLSVQLETATKYAARGDPSLHAELQEARLGAKACLTDVRHSVEALHPSDTSAGSLPERLRRLAAEFATTCRETTITLDLDEATHPLNPDLSLTLFRCAQEALTNIRKHAQATRVFLYLGTSSEPERRVELTVLDNGQGGVSEHEEYASGFGLRGMRERVLLLNGTMQAGSDPGHGWRVAVMIPLEQPKQAEVIARTVGGRDNDGSADPCVDYR